jgi:hypothetical protein
VAEAPQKQHYLLKLAQITQLQLVLVGRELPVRQVVTAQVRSLALSPQLVVAVAVVVMPQTETQTLVVLVVVAHKVLATVLLGLGLLIKDLLGLQHNLL